MRVALACAKLLLSIYMYSFSRCFYPNEEHHKPFVIRARFIAYKFKDKARLEYKLEQR